MEGMFKDDAKLRALLFFGRCSFSWTTLERFSIQHIAMKGPYLLPDIQSQLVCHLNCDVQS
eukprot:scaffold1110_cov399-Pavlova_lutheri.AAC.6